MELTKSLSLSVHKKKDAQTPPTLTLRSRDNFATHVGVKCHQNGGKIDKNKINKKIISTNSNGS